MIIKEKVQEFEQKEELGKINILIKK